MKEKVSEKGQVPVDESLAQKLESNRLGYAIEQLYPHHLEQYISVCAMTSGNWMVPKTSKWTKDTELLGNTNIFPAGFNNPPYPSYFKSHAELESGFKKVGDLYRQYDPNSDSQAFGINTSEYSLIRVSKSGGVAVGSKKEEKDEFTVYVIASQDLEREILEMALENINPKLNELQEQKAYLEGKIQQLKPT